MSAAAILGFIVSHLDLIEVIYDAIVNRQVPKEKLLAVVKDAMTEASDAEMRRELP